MTVRVGVIGVGMIGQDHIRRLSRVLAGASVVAVSDVDPVKAQEVATRYGAGTAIRVHATGQDVVSDPQVDVVVVCSWGSTHEEYVLAAIAAAKPVFCEKPLAETPAACLRIIDAETATGRRLVQVGYMRRYDAGYRALKDVVDSGSISTTRSATETSTGTSSSPFCVTFGSMRETKTSQQCVFSDGKKMLTASTDGCWSGSSRSSKPERTSV